MAFTDVFAEVLAQVPGEHMDQDRFVPATGPLDADVVLVGEAPGADEVAEGEPFVGRAGQVLDDLLAELGVDRDDLYITNLVKIRPPDNRDPTDAEIAAWEPVLDAELEHVAPATVVPLGNVAAQALTGVSKGISRIHGRTFEADGYRIIPAYHPAATLYDPATRPKLREDLDAAFSDEATGQTRLTDL